MTRQYGSSDPIDPQLRAAFASLAGARGPLRTESIAAYRAQLEARAWSLDRLRGRASVQVVSATGPSGRPSAGPSVRPSVELLVLRPLGVGRLAGCIYFMHSGGMILGNNRVAVEQALEWAEEIDAIVVSPEYRLAPEHPDPAPSEDCYAGLTWVTAHSSEVAIDPSRVIVAGMSAGGGLAAAMALMARDRGGPRLAGQLLIAPMLDDRPASTASTAWPAELEDIGSWDSETNRTAWRALLGPAAGGTDVSPYAAPARASNLTGLPSAYLDVGEVELFRPPVVAYAEGLRRSGVPTELHVWPGAFHGFDQVVPDAQVSVAARAARRHWLQRLG